jgi:hypothetical protein
VLAAEFWVSQKPENKKCKVVRRCRMARRT